jgi:uncharacterized membrane protein YdjX (TVP38/TMEM64 family)
MKRLLLLFLGLSALILMLFALSGEAIETWFNLERTIDLFQQNRWLAGPLGAALLIVDLFLPIPTTIIIGAMGSVLGITQGTFWGWLGLNLSAWLGYGLARWKGVQWAKVSAGDQERFSEWFNRSGAWAVLLSRWVPILPEVISLLAGLYGMSSRKFLAAVALGSLPPAWLYAWMGATAVETPVRSVLLLVGTTALGWLLFQRFSNPSDSGKKD